MRVRKKKRRFVVLFATGLTLTSMALSHNMGSVYAATNGPQTIKVSNSKAHWVTVSQGTLKSDYYGNPDSIDSGYHRTNVIQEEGKNDRDSYVFCIDWSKESPSNQQLQREYQANPAIQWLVTDFSKGHDKAFERIDGQRNNNFADYWLYQTVIHMVASPNATFMGDKPDAYIQDFNPTIRNKIYRLKAEALKHKNESDSEIVLNSAKLDFDPSSLNIGAGDLHGNKYEKSFKTKSQNMSDVKVQAENSADQKYISGRNLNNVSDNDTLKISVPYNEVGNGKTFKVKATGNWKKEAKVAWVYGAGANVQKVAHSGVKATTVPLNANTEMTVKVSPTYGKLTFIKKGTGNNNTDLLPGTKFTLTADGGFSQTATADKDGRVTFNNLPLGKKFHLKETYQPNGDYNGSYDRDITELTGNNPKVNVDLGTVSNHKRYGHFDVNKVNVNGTGIQGAQFVLIRKPQNAPFNSVSIEDAKKQAMRQVNGELVTGHSDQKPYIITTDASGKASFDKVLLDDGYYDYYAVEVKSPNGYALGSTPIKYGGIGPTSATRVKGEMKDSVQPIPTTGSKELLIESITLGVTITIGATYAYYEGKRER